MQPKVVQNFDLCIRTASQIINQSWPAFLWRAPLFLWIGSSLPRATKLLGQSLFSARNSAQIDGGIAKKDKSQLESYVLFQLGADNP
jgi:hypothetical protein